ncbi:MAG: hypothetical protein J7527_09780, partial [Chitinophagaceae bacterium]|nr:hypothetical protein [Chitinophagaceae bacterium]
MSIQQNDTDSEKTFVKRFTSTEEEQEFCMRYDIMRNDLEKFQLFCKSYRISKILKSPGKVSFQQSLEDQQFFNLFRSLETNSVRYLVAGGLAMLAYGHSFADTSYIDIWIEDTSTNRKNLRQSFSKAGYG